MDSVGCMCRFSFRLIISLICICRICSYDCIRFKGGGIYYWWQAGACKYLLENTELTNKQLPVYGTSAGALSAALFVSGTSMDRAAELAISLSEERQVFTRRGGLAGIWGQLIEDWLQELIPDTISPASLARVNVVVTPRRIWKGPQLLSSFESKDELISGCMASAHIPFFLDKKPWRKCTKDNKRYIDGSFWQFVNKGEPEKYPLSYVHRNVLDLDYSLDTEFIKELQQSDSSIVKLITPEGLYDMMNRGYKYTEKLHQQGNLNNVVKSTVELR